MRIQVYTICAATIMMVTGGRAAGLEEAFRNPQPKRAETGVWAEAGAGAVVDGAKPQDRYLVRVDTLLEAGEHAISVPAGKLMSACMTRQGGYGVSVVTDKIIDVAGEGRDEARISIPHGRWRVQLFFSVPCEGFFSGGRLDSRAWSDEFNDCYHRRYKTKPDAIYPVLFGDANPDGGEIRIRMLSLRDSLTGGAGDALMYYGGAGIPTYDAPENFRDSIENIHIPASAAYIYDKPHVAYHVEGTTAMLYRKAMDAYSRGVNLLSFSGSDEDLALWSARCESMLQGSAHVSKVGILYPLEEMRSGFYFDDPVPYLLSATYTGLHRLMRTLTTEVRRDFTLLHPEVLDTKCEVGTGVMRLNDTGEEYGVIVVPGCKTIDAKNLEKLVAFAERGGRVLFTGDLPKFSANDNKHTRVEQLVNRIMSSGHGQHIEQPDRDNLDEFFSKIPNARDIDVEIVYSIYKMDGGPQDERTEILCDHAYACNYIHKRKEGRDLYFLANPTDCHITAQLSFADTRAPQLWDPHTGEISTPPSETISSRRVMQLELAPLRSCFVVF